MEAPSFRALALVVALNLLGVNYLHGANHRSANFVVTAPTDQMAVELCQAAETYRRDLAILWLGSPMPTWSAPCPIEAHVAPNLGAGGATSFLFDHGEVFGWQMTIQGSWERVLDSVLPHEITHTIFATHFRRPLPRWADEGACTTVEHVSERTKQQMMLVDFLRNDRGIAFSRMFVMKDYPRDVMPLYSQGYSLARYLISQGGRRKFLDFVADGMQDENWTRAISRHYSYENLAVLQNTWLDWVRQGSPALETPATSAPIAAIAASTPAAPAGGSVYGGQGAAARLTPDVAATTPAPSALPLAKLVDREESRPAPTSLAKSDNQGWHAPRRDAVLSQPEPASPVQSEVAGYQHQSSPTVSPQALSGSDPSAYQATRPQPIQRPRQTILEWSRQDPPAATGGDMRLATDQTTWR